MIHKEIFFFSILAHNLLSAEWAVGVTRFNPVLDAMRMEVMLVIAL